MGRARSVSDAEFVHYRAEKVGAVTLIGFSRPLFIERGFPLAN